MDYLDVLILCAAPVDARVTLNLGQELANLEREIRRSGLPLRVKSVFPPTLAQLEKDLGLAERLGRRPAVFHFLGHGDGDGLYFEDEHGRSELVKGPRLKRALARHPVRLALLNACWSATKRGLSLCEFLTRESLAEAAVGHEQPVADASAVTFAHRFYEQLIAGDSVRAACGRAANALAEQGLTGGSDVQWVGDGDLRLTEGLAAGLRAPVIEVGLPARGGLPDPGVFYGRGEELAEISAALADASRVAVGLWGIGGIGKTALAQRAARRNAWRYAGAAWVDARDAPEKTTAALLRLALSQLFPADPGWDPAFELRKRLEETPALICLDNLEDLPAPEHAALARFLHSVPRRGSAFLLTARVPLAPVEALTDVLTRRLTEGLDDWHGAHYVQHIARQRKCLALENELRIPVSATGLTVTGPEGLCVLVSRRLHGHPKMLELAVGLAACDPDAFNRALAALPGHLEEQLAPLLATCLEALHPEGLRLLPFLTFFPTGRLTPEALDAVCRAAEDAGRAATAPQPGAEMHAEDAGPAAAGAPLPWVTRGRAQLVAAGLLEYDQATATCSFHQLVLDTAQRRAPAPEVQGAVWVGLLLHYAHYCALHRAASGQLDRCFASVLVLMEGLWQARSEPGPLDAVLTALVASLAEYMQLRGHWQTAVIWNDRILGLPLDSGARAQRLFEQARLLRGRNDPAGARALLAQSLRLYEESGEQRAIGVILHEMAGIEAAQGNPEEARRLLQRSLTIKEALGDQRGLSASLHALAGIEAAQGNLGEARRLYARSIALKEAVGEVAGRAASLGMLAQVEAMEGNRERALELAREAVRDLEARGYAQAEDARAVLRAIEGGGAGSGSGPGADLLARLPGLLTEWEALSGEARHARLNSLRATGADPEEAVLALLAHAVVCWNEGEPSACAAALAEARTAAAEQAELLGTVEALEQQFRQAAEGANPLARSLNAAMAHLQGGRAAEALPLLEAAEALTREAGDSQALAAVLFYLGQARLLLDQPLPAVTALREALDLAAESADDGAQQAIRQVLTVAVQAAAGSSAPNRQGDTR